MATPGQRQPQPPRPSSPAPARAQPSRRRRAEIGFLRLAGAGGIVAIGTALGAVLGSQDVRGWVIGLAVGLVTLVLGAILRVTLRP